MRTKVVCSVLFVTTFLSLRLLALEAGSSVLYILGKDKSSREFQSFKETWGLNTKYENNIRGIKVFVNESNSTVDGVLFAGENFKLNESRFVKYSSPLPYGISLNDNETTLGNKLGRAVPTPAQNTWKFHKDDVSIEVAYASADNSVIYSVKCYNNPSAAAYAPKPIPQSPPVLMASLGNPVPEIKKVPSNADLEKPASSVSFKQAIMDVFKAYRESSFYNIKGKQRAEKNFFNYKYTYSSKLKIPGEKFSMLYSFPFTTSNLDFISILKESDTYDKSFEVTYHDFEKKLMETFPAKDGWVASCVPNKESKTMSDIQFRNDRYGAVVLDYCQNPKGKHILYLRFLLFS